MTTTQQLPSESDSNKESVCSSRCRNRKISGGIETTRRRRRSGRQDDQTDLVFLLNQHSHHLFTDSNRVPFASDSLYFPFLIPNFFLSLPLSLSLSLSFDFTRQFLRWTLIHFLVVISLFCCWLPRIDDNHRE
jgi:hypothetical protein